MTSFRNLPKGFSDICKYSVTSLAKLKTKCYTNSVNALKKSAFPYKPLPERD